MLSLYSRILLTASLMLCASFIYAKDSPPSTQDTPKASAQNIAQNQHIVGGIAIKVNNDPITLYEIQSLSAKQHISKDKAQEILIAQRLKDQEIKRLNIIADDTRLEQEMQSIAAQNNLSYQQFIQALYQQGLTPESYKAKLKEQIQTRELMRNILLSADTASEETMRKYYDTHKNEFITADLVQTIRYNSKDPKLLERAIANTTLTLNGVEKTPEKLKLNTLNPQIAQMFAQLQKGQFSPILDAGNGSYVAFLVQEKSGDNAMSFEEAKPIIAQKLAQDHQEQILSEYFEKIKQKAHIEYVRK